MSSPETGGAPRSSAGVTLEGLARDPSQVATLDPESVPALLAQLAALQGLLAARLLVPNGHGEAPSEDRLLTAQEAASILHTSADYLYRHARTLPFSVRVGHHLRFSSHGLARYIRQRTAR